MKECRLFIGSLLLVTLPLYACQSKAVRDDVVVALEVGEPRAPEWDFSSNDPLQMVSLTVKVTGLDLSGDANYVVDTYVGAVSPLDASLSAEELQIARSALMSEAKAYDLGSSVDLNGIAEIELDITRLPPGPQTVLVLVEDTADRSFAQGSISWERPFVIANQRSYPIRLQVLGTQASIKIEEPNGYGEHPTDLTIDGYFFPPELTATVRGQTLKEGQQTIHVSMLEQLRNAKLSDIAQHPPKLDANITVAFEHTAGHESEVQVEILGEPVVKAFLAMLDNHVRDRKGFLFPDETISSGRRSLLAYSVVGGELIGPDVTLGEVDLIAQTTEAGNPRTRSCGPYVGEGGGTGKTLTIQASDLAVVVVDRRTGQEVAKRTFKGNMPACPTSFVGDANAGSYGMSGEFAEEGRIRKWLESQITP